MIIPKKILLNLRNALAPSHAILNRFIKPRAGYFLFPAEPKRRLKPLSRKHGFDRGTPIDRYYIEKFLDENRAVIKGRCLEIHDNAYTKRFGGFNVSQSDILDIDTKNNMANVYGDLRHLTNMASNVYDTIILTHTIGMIDDIWSVVKECRRILKPGGSVLVTASAGIKPHRHPEQSFWRFGIGSMRYLFGRDFNLNQVKIKTYGNVLVCQAFLVGLALEELTPEELEHNDPHFPLIITVVATK